MADIDIKLQGKQAEFETISRAIASLLEQHDKLRKDFDVELEEKSKKITDKLDKDLAKKRKELSNIEKDILRHKEIDENLIKDADKKQIELDEQDKRLKREKIVIERVVSDLNTKKLSLESEISVLDEEKADLINNIDKKHLELVSINEKIEASNSKASEIQFNIDTLETNFNFNKQQYEKDEADAKIRLNIINSNLDKSSRSLHEVQLQESTIRQDLADWELRLNKRESTIDGREAKVTQQEKRVFNYTKFTGL